MWTQILLSSVLKRFQECYLDTHLEIVCLRGNPLINVKADQILVAHY